MTVVLTHLFKLLSFFPLIYYNVIPYIIILFATNMLNNEYETGAHKPAIWWLAVKTMCNTVAHFFMECKVVYKNLDCQRISGTSLLELRCRQHSHNNV